MEQHHPSELQAAGEADYYVPTQNFLSVGLADYSFSRQITDPQNFDTTGANFSLVAHSAKASTSVFNESFASESAAEDSENQAALDALSCAICLDTLCEPLKLGCNHLFCRVCLHFVMRTSAERKCPMCRAIIDIGDCTTQPVDEETDSAIRKVLPETVYLERKEAARVELRVQMTEALSCLPIHISSGVGAHLVQPGQRSEISFAEPNGQVLRRAMESNRLILCVDAPPVAGSWAVLVRPLPRSPPERVVAARAPTKRAPLSSGG